MTPLSYVPGGKIERYLGNLNFFFIRESTCIREVTALFIGTEVYGQVGGTLFHIAEVIGSYRGTKTSCSEFMVFVSHVSR